MNRDSNDCRRISRRVVLAGTTFTFGAVAASAAVSRALAQQKISQEVAKYQGSPNGDKRCDGCFNFQAPNGCRFVDGNISPSGWCQLFTPKT